MTSPPKKPPSACFSQTPLFVSTDSDVEVVPILKRNLPPMDQIVNYNTIVDEAERERNETIYAGLADEIEKYGAYNYAQADKSDKTNGWNQLFHACYAPEGGILSAFVIPAAQERVSNFKRKIVEFWTLNDKKVAMKRAAKQDVSFYEEMIEAQSFCYQKTLKRIEDNRSNDRAYKSMLAGVENHYNVAGARAGGVSSSLSSQTISMPPHGYELGQLLRSITPRALELASSPHPSPIAAVASATASAASASSPLSEASVETRTTPWTSDPPKEPLEEMTKSLNKHFGETLDLMKKTFEARKESDEFPLPASVKANKKLLAEIRDLEQKIKFYEKRATAAHSAGDETMASKHSKTVAMLTEKLEKLIEHAS